MREHTRPTKEDPRNPARTDLVLLRIRNVAGHCCYCDVIAPAALGGEVLYTTEPYPYGFDQGAWNKAEAWAKTHGWKVE